MKNQKNKPTILIVDDEDDARALILGFLNIRYECDFKEASDGQEAIDIIRSSGCDLILLDIKMPKKGGIEVIKEAKKINPNIDILVISAWASDDVSEEAIRLGATDYILKPIDLAALNLKFANMLDKRGQKISKI